MQFDGLIDKVEIEVKKVLVFFQVLFGAAFWRITFDHFVLFVVLGCLLEYFDCVEKYF